jgi:hypothetical protein
MLEYFFMYTGVMNTSKYILSAFILIATAVAGFSAGIFVPKNYHFNVPQPFTPGEYKTIGFSAEIPETWSYQAFACGYVGPAQSSSSEDIRNSRLSSISQDAISHNDTSWRQVDIYSVSAQTIQEWINGLKTEAESKGKLSTTTLSGLPATVLTEELDHGEVTKAGSGGKTYFIPAAEVVIVQQAQGDEEFEREVNHFLRTFDLRKIKECVF